MRATSERKYIPRTRSSKPIKRHNNHWGIPVHKSSLPVTGTLYWLRDLAEFSNVKFFLTLEVWIKRLFYVFLDPGGGSPKKSEIKPKLKSGTDIAGKTQVQSRALWLGCNPLVWKIILLVKAAFNPHSKKLLLKIILEKKACAALSLKFIYRTDCKKTKNQANSSQPHWKSYN